MPEVATEQPTRPDWGWWHPENATTALLQRVQEDQGQPHQDAAHTGDHVGDHENAVHDLGSLGLASLGGHGVVANPAQHDAGQEPGARLAELAAQE